MHGNTPRLPNDEHQGGAATRREQSFTAAWDAGDKSLITEINAKILFFSRWEIARSVEKGKIEEENQENHENHEPRENRIINIEIIESSLRDTHWIWRITYRVARLTMAKPEDAVSLRSYLLERYGILIRGIYIYFNICIYSEYSKYSEYCIQSIII